ncbi:tumor suppressor candidate 2-like [Acomys russatus]|uniref:tumor suppressor candidate 2-like n=1 Tax=Acomys russatus TaxID=60746 RepID=UPI0021E1C182|nr:tumor suppressor candidate 2-like [Acomys russatus]
MGGSSSKALAFCLCYRGGEVRVRVREAVTPFVFTRHGSMFYGKDRDLAHKFYEETIVTKNRQKRAKPRQIYKNQTPQGIVRLDPPTPYTQAPESTWISLVLLYEV